MFINRNWQCIFGQCLCSKFEVSLFDRPSFFLWVKTHGNRDYLVNTIENSRTKAPQGVKTILLSMVAFNEIRTYNVIFRKNHWKDCLLKIQIMFIHHVLTTISTQNKIITCEIKLDYPDRKEWFSQKSYKQSHFCIKC